MKIKRIRQIHTESLSVEPMLRRTSNGELLCVCSCGGTCEPSLDNKLCYFHSSDNGESWSEKSSIKTEPGRAVCLTELFVSGDEITAFAATHDGGFLDWRCEMIKSIDNGYTWRSAGAPPFFPTYSFIRSSLRLKNGVILLPYQHYPITDGQVNDLIRDEKRTVKRIDFIKTDYVESGVLLSRDNGKSFERHRACEMSLENHWSWSEPTLAQLPDGGVAMLMRNDTTGCLWRCDSSDSGLSWGELCRTDIPNPSNKPRLFNTPDGIVLINTPSTVRPGGAMGLRFPLEVWRSDDGMKTWCEKLSVTDFPGSYNYTDGFYEDGHILFTIEHNRHTILFIDIEL